MAEIVGQRPVLYQPGATPQNIAFYFLKAPTARLIQLGVYFKVIYQ